MKVVERLKSIKILSITVIAMLGVGGSLFVQQWMQHNRYEVFYCLLETFSEGIFPNHISETYLNRLTKGETEFDGFSRLNLLLRYTEYGRCAPLDEEKFRQIAKNTADEYNWPESYFIQALIYGYGGFVEGKLGSPTDILLFPLWVYTEEERYRIKNDFGNGKDLNLSLSFALLKKSAESGNHTAQEFLSGAYYRGYWGKANGLYIGTDYKQSTEWLESAAKIEVGYANLYIGHRYRYAGNYGLQPDYQKAYQHYTAAAASEDAIFDAMLELAIMSGEGIGIEASAEQAVMWLDKAQRRLDEMKGLQKTWMQDLRRRIAEMHNQQAIREEDLDEQKINGKIRQSYAQRYERFNAVKRKIDNLYDKVSERR